MVKWPHGIYMLLISVPLGMKGEIWFKGLGIPLGVLLGFEINHRVYAAVAQHYSMSNTGWQVAWIAFAVILSMVFGTVIFFNNYLDILLLQKVW